MESHKSVMMMSVSEITQHWRFMFNQEMSHAEDLVGHPDNHYVMFKKEDATAWLCFTISFTILIIFDNFILNRGHQKIGMLRAAVQTVFWMLCAGAFAVYVYYRNGHNASFDWTSGYMLEWMLSFDNLFVFHLIFNIYQTPDHLKHKPLFWGICGAVFFRLAFIFIGEYLMHAMWAAHLFFGAFLVYTGVESAMADEDDEDPTQHPMVQWLTSNIPFIPIYDKGGNFFVDVPCDKDGNALIEIPSITRDSSENESTTASENDIERADDSSSVSSDDNRTSRSPQNYGTLVREESTSFFEMSSDPRFHHYEKRATMLFLVVVCLEISDILFAVDSVSAIVAQVSDLFLAYTSAVFAMLGLRSTFFIIDVLVKLFSLLKYGVAAVLVFIGIKLIVSKVYHIPPMVVCAVLFTTLASSMVASVVVDKLGWNNEDEDDAEVDEKIEEKASILTEKKVQQKQEKQEKKAA